MPQAETRRSVPPSTAVSSGSRGAAGPAQFAVAPAATAASPTSTSPATVGLTKATPTPAASAPQASAGCPSCWGAGAPSTGQAINTVINHLFNSAFDWAATLPGGPLSSLLEGALVLVRRSLFLSPLGVTATQTGNSLQVSVNTGSVAYLREVGTSLEISGLPSFRGAQTFENSTQLTLLVANSPGNAGCAGVVVESGVINGVFQSSQIDSLRFGPGAAFNGAVQARVSGGPLVVRDAVRGQAGVILDASVVLANDVEIDGGGEYANFTGTVDAAKAGKQSLTVTALGRTTFGGAVGGQSPLAGLLTRGVAPITIQQSSDSKTIPLHYLPEYNATGEPLVKYGIDVAIGDNPSQTYEFDTGGVAFFAGYNRQFWQNVPLTTTGVSEVYSSGIVYDGVISNTPITLGSGSRTVSTAQPIQIAAILAGGNPGKDVVFDFTNPAVPPVEDRFFGDFGASFTTLAVNGLDTALANPLFQLPGNLSSGFLVQLGPIGTDPQLTVGVTDELRAQFPYAVPVQAVVGGGTYPVSGLPVLEWFGFSPSYFAQKGDDPKVPIGDSVDPLQCASKCLPSLIDSGAPSTGIRLKGGGGDPFNSGGQLEPGVKFIAEFPTTEGRVPLEWSFVAGNTGSVNLVQYQQGSLIDGSNQNVNTGLNIYNSFDVMFDVKKQVIWLRPTGGDSTVSAQSVTTTGDQTYQQSATLAGTYSTGGGRFSVSGVTTLLGNTVVEAGSGDVRFSGTVDSAADGARSLTVNSSGATDFVRGVGLNAALTSLTTDVGGSTSSSGVITNRDQTYNDDASLNGQYLVGAGKITGSFTVSGNSTLNGPISIQASTGDIRFGGTVDALPGKGFSIILTTAPGNDIRFNKDIGSTHPVGGLAVVNPEGNAQKPATFSAMGKVTLAGSLGFPAAQGISVGDHVTTTLTGGGQVDSFTGDGISLGASKGSQVSNFIVSNNGGDGIVATNAENLTLTKGAVINNVGNGIHLVTSQSGGSGGVEVSESSINGNGLNGIASDGTSAVLIEKTTISGNGSGPNAPPAGDNGVLLSNSSNVTVRGSAIYGNANGGILSLGSTAVAIEENTVYQNGNSGITVDTGVGNGISSNSIYYNGTTTADGITLQNGGNDRQKAPVVRTAEFEDGYITVTGSLPDSGGGTYRIEVFYTPVPPSDKLPVQGQQYLGDAEFADGTFSGRFASPQPAPGNYITATATPTAGDPNTSEFSTAVLVVRPPKPTA